MSARFVAHATMPVAIGGSPAQLTGTGVCEVATDPLGQVAGTKSLETGTRGRSHRRLEAGVQPGGLAWPCVQEITHGVLLRGTLRQ
jgi:hypothetical protein